MSFPFITIWLGDYHKDTLTLDAEEHGAYLLILFELWNRDGELPLDEDLLRRVARVKSARRWRTVWAKISPYFLFGAGIIRHRRIDRELQKASQSLAIRRQAGALGGKETSKKNRAREAALLQHGYTKSTSSPSLESLPSVGVEPRATSDAVDNRVVPMKPRGDR